MKRSLLHSGAALLAVALQLTAVAPAQAGKAGKNAPTETFTITSGTHISMEGRKSVTLADLKAGDHVSIAYTDAGGVLTAGKIKDLGANPGKHGKTTAKTSHASHAATGLHAHGIVKNVNVAERILTINAHQHHES